MTTAAAGAQDDRQLDTSVTIDIDMGNLVVATATEAGQASGHPQSAEQPSPAPRKKKKLQRPMLVRVPQVASPQSAEEDDELLI